MTKQELYIRAIKNLLKQINFLELNQRLLEKQITEKEFENEIEMNVDKYSVNIENLDNEETLKEVAEIFQEIDMDDEVSINEVGDIFGIDISKLIEKYEKK